MDIYEAGRQKVQRERESAGRMKAAAKSPLSSTGGGGFQRGTGVSEKANDYVPSAPKTATEMGGAVDKGEPPVSYGQDSLNYLGHMAGNNVAAEGHNVVPYTGQQGFGMIGSLSPNNPNKYLGHLAGDNVMTEGHNTVPKSAVSKKISHLVKSEGKPQKQAVAMALNMKREGRLTPEGGYIRAKKGK